MKTVIGSIFSLWLLTLRVAGGAHGLLALNLIGSRMAATHALLPVVDTTRKEVKRYYKSGQLLEQYTLVDSFLEGKRTMYYQNGHLDREMTFHKGRPSGLYQAYDKKGNLERQIGYLDGLMDGPWIFYIKGVKAIESHFTQGKINGWYYAYHQPSGTLAIKALYGNGRLVSKVSEYSKNGVLVSELVPNQEGNRVVMKINYDKAGQRVSTSTIDEVPTGTYLGPAIMGGFL